MRVAKEKVDVKMEIPGAVIRQQTDFGDASGLGKISGEYFTLADANGNRETVRANDLFYWPPGHNVKVDADAEIVMFSPQREHTHVINHMIEKVKG